MFLLDTSFFPKYIILTPTDDWGDGFVDNYYDIESRLLCFLEEAIKLNGDNKIVFVYKCAVKNMTPISILMRIVKGLVMNRELIKNALSYTIIYGENEDYLSGINFILGYYTPVMPLHVCEGPEQLHEFLKNQLLDDVDNTLFHSISTLTT